MEMQMERKPRKYWYVPNGGGLIIGLAIAIVFWACVILAIVKFT